MYMQAQSPKFKPQHPVKKKKKKKAVCLSLFVIPALWGVFLMREGGPSLLWVVPLLGRWSFME